MGEIETQLREIFGSNQRIGADDNTKVLLETACAMGLVRRTGAMVNRPPKIMDGITLLGATIPVVGRLFDQYERRF